MRRGYARIKAIATYLPSKIEKNEGVSEVFRAKLGIDQRHVASDDESAGDLAIAVAENLFRQYGIERKEVEFILLCVQHPDYQVPTTACSVQSSLGIPNSCGALDYGLGCSGYVYGLSLAKGMIETGMVHNVLLLTSSVYLKYINKKDGAIRPLFGDGATATFLAAEESEQPFLHSFVFGSDGSNFDKLIIPAGGSRNMPRQTKEVFETDDQGNTRSNYEVYMDGVEIAYFTLREVPKLVEQVLGKAGLERKDIDYYVFHQASKFVLEYVQKKCKLMEYPFYNDVRDIGNTVSGTIPFALEHLTESLDSKLENVMLAGFGVGLSWAGCIADLSRMLPKRTL